MKYIIMCGRPTFVEIQGEQLVARTIRLLQENGIDDIAITSMDDRYEEFGVPVIKYDSCRSPYYWVNCFYQTDEPTCYMFGDVFYSNNAIKTIVETEVDDIQFFASAPPFAPRYTKPHAEPFAFKVVDTKKFKRDVERTKQLYDKKAIKRCIAWELWQVIKHTDLNRIVYNNYVAINDYTRDLDDEKEAEEFKCFIKKYGILDE